MQHVLLMREYLLKHPDRLAISIYIYDRLIINHNNNNLNPNHGELLYEKLDNR